MAVPALDLKAIWSAGAHYADWLAACDPAKREEMEMIHAGVALSPDDTQFLQGLKRDVHVLAISEDWCGDVRRNIPPLARMCAAGTRLHLRVVDKETKPEMMVRYLTNAAEAIPVFVFFSDAFVEVGHWGPRPLECKRLMARGKAAGKIDDARAAIRAFYEADQHRSTIEELRGLIEIASADAV
ncbi:MAG: thioredoxin family protein [Planctomycetota bacterium]|nr:thioredoxin family protein [Planctomycetota bacterium]